MLTRGESVLKNQIFTAKQKEPATPIFGMDTHIGYVNIHAKNNLFVVVFLVFRINKCNYCNDDFRKLLNN